MLRKVIAVTATFAMLLSFAACGKKSEETSTTKPATQVLQEYTTEKAKTTTATEAVTTKEVATTTEESTTKATTVAKTEGTTVASNTTTTAKKQSTTAQQTQIQQQATQAQTQHREEPARSESTQPRTTTQAPVTTKVTTATTPATTRATTLSTTTCTTPTTSSTTTTTTTATSTTTTSTATTTVTTTTEPPVTVPVYTGPTFDISDKSNPGFNPSTYDGWPGHINGNEIISEYAGDYYGNLFVHDEIIYLDQMLNYFGFYHDDRHVWNDHEIGFVNTYGEEIMITPDSYDVRLDGYSRTRQWSLGGKTISNGVDYYYMNDEVLNYILADIIEHDSHIVIHEYD